jgi:NAD(P)-dependent dehydrogenase (short-subunit alcohol dehydrogenase family)
VDQRRHEGRSVVVTGAAHGIGRGIAERFHAEGARVVLADLDAATARAVADGLGPRAVAVACDVRREADLQQAVDAAVESFGGLDVMVNNAGIMAVGALVDTDAESWRRVLDVNVVGIALGSKVAARAIVAAGRGGCIVNASSGAGRHGVPGFAQYCASKAAVIMLSQSLAQELAPSRIRVNCYTPGHVMTPLWEDIVAGLTASTGRSRDDVLDQFLATVPWGRFGTPADVAGAVSWLCTDDAEYITGQCLAMNGGELPW